MANDAAMSAATYINCAGITARPFSQVAGMSLQEAS